MLQTNVICMQIATIIMVTARLIIVIQMMLLTDVKLNAVKTFHFQTELICHIVENL